MIALLKREIGTAPFRIRQYHPPCGSRLARNVVERMAPEFDHAAEFIAVDYDRTDTHCSPEQFHEGSIPAHNCPDASGKPAAQ